MSRATDLMNALGVEPLERIYHWARLIREDGAVSPWCAKKPRALNLAKESWTRIERQVTCAKCVKARMNHQSTEEK